MKLNIGCGQKHLEGYLNVDIAEPADKVVNLEKPLPFEDESVSYIMADNVLEHITNVIQLMDECCRILTPEGEMEAIVPLFPSPAAVADPTHVRFFVPETFERFKFKVKHIETYGERFQFIRVVLVKPERV